MTLWQSYFGGRRGGSCAVERRSGRTRYPSGSGCGSENRILVCVIGHAWFMSLRFILCVLCVIAHWGAARPRARARRSVLFLQIAHPVSVPHAHNVSHISPLALYTHALTREYCLLRRIRGRRVLRLIRTNLRTHTSTQTHRITAGHHGPRTARRGSQRRHLICNKIRVSCAPGSTRQLE